MGVVSMAYVTEEQIEKAKRLDLLTYLETFEPQELVKLSGGLYSTKTHDSVIIRNGAWFRNATGDYGFTALDYLVKVYGIPFVRAVEELSGERATENVRHRDIHYPRTLPEKKPFKLPARNNNDRKAVAYLKSCGIGQEIIGFCQRTGRFYEHRHEHCPVFIGLDSEDKPRYAVTRRNTTDHRRRFKEAPGSNKCYAFSIPAMQESNHLLVFESAIDLISYCTLSDISDQGWQQLHLLALGGVYMPQKGREFTRPKALEQYLKTYPQIERLTLLLDGDEKGIRASAEILKAYGADYSVRSIALPDGMDVNDILKSTVQTKNNKEMKRKNEVIHI